MKDLDMRRQTWSRLYTLVFLTFVAVCVMHYVTYTESLLPWHRQDQQEQVPGSNTLAKLGEKKMELLKQLSETKGDETKMESPKRIVSGKAVTKASSTVQKALTPSGMRNIDDLAAENVWKTPEVPAHLQNAAWDDEELIQHIRKHWILAPSVTTPPYNSTEHTAEDKAHIIGDIFKQKRGGFFVECGASDGVKASDTIILERDRGWSGLLIEADPALFAKLVETRRNNYVTRTCVSPTDFASVQRFVHVNRSILNGLYDYMEKSHYSNIKDCGVKNLTLQCFPLASILKAVGVTKIDYLSLDLEGPELEVLQSLPFDEFEIDTMAVEFRVMGSSEATVRKRRNIEHFMTQIELYKQIANNTHDIILRKI